MRIVRFTLILLTTVLVVTEAATQERSRPRAREAGVIVGVLQPGPLNAITDVGGVAVGHQTLIRGDNVRTGVTAILPHNGNLFRDQECAWWAGRRRRGRRGHWYSRVWFQRRHWNVFP